MPNHFRRTCLLTSLALLLGHDGVWAMAEVPINRARVVSRQVRRKWLGMLVSRWGGVQSSCTPVALMGFSQRARSVRWAAARSAELEPMGS